MFFSTCQCQRYRHGMVAHQSGGNTQFLMTLKVRVSFKTHKKRDALIEFLLVSLLIFKTYKNVDIHLYM